MKVIHQHPQVFHRTNTGLCVAVVLVKVLKKGHHQTNLMMANGIEQTLAKHTAKTDVKCLVVGLITTASHRLKRACCDHKALFLAMLWGLASRSSVDTGGNGQSRGDYPGRMPVHRGKSLDCESQ